MSRPTSLRLSDDLRDRLARRAAARQDSASAVAVQLIDEGLRMLDHPGIVFRDSPVHGRVAGLASGPDVAEVVAVATGLDVTGEERLEETATWLSLHPSQVRAALRYQVDHPDEIADQLERRRAIAVEERARYEAQQALLG